MGGTLIHWVNKNYLRKLNLPEIHIYDSDVSKYAQTVSEVNSRPNCWATQTQMLELENYIHPSLYNIAYPITEQFVDLSSNWISTWSSRDIPSELSRFLKNEKAAGNSNIKNDGASSIKNIFSSELSKHMTEQLLKDLNAYDEVNGWFEQIKKYL